MATIVITGANRGIGLELARQFKARNDRVVALCRRATPELRDIGVDIVDEIDVADANSLATLKTRLSVDSIDILVNNAGILRRTSLDALDFDSIREQFEVNAMGPLRVVDTLRPHLRAGSKVAIITSRMGSITDNTSGGSYGYRMSKSAVNMAGVSLAHDLRSVGIAVALLHPGWVRTDMTGGRGLCDVDESARGLIARIDELTLETSGGFWHQNGERLPW